MMGGRSRRKMRGGNFYGFAGSIGTNGPEWNAVRNAGADSATAALKPELYDIQTGGRRRKSRKASRRRRARRGGVDPDTEGTSPAQVPDEPAGPKSEGIPSDITEPKVDGGRRRKSKKAKKSRRKTRKMRGGASYLPATAGVSGFTGAGVARGMGGFQDVSGGYARLNDVTPLA
jgi:hypothetical protein